MTISVCMIVKNEEKVLGDCLKSISPFADEIIINDTGSTDATVSIAESFGAKIIHSEWVDDFSYSRNISLKKASCDWVFWLDADDTIPDYSIEEILYIKNKKPDRVYNIKCMSLTKDGTYEVHNQARIFPNNMGVHFERAIYEQFITSAFNVGLPLENSNIEVHHSGYSDPEIRVKKAIRNSRILMKDYYRGDRSPYLLLKLGVNNETQGNWDTSEGFYREYLRLYKGFKNNIENTCNVYHGLGRINFNKGLYKNAEEFLTLGLNLGALRPDMQMTLARSLFYQEKFKEAISLLEDILSTDFNMVRSNIDKDNIIMRALRLTGDCHYCIDNKDLALKFFWSSYKVNKRGNHRTVFRVIDLLSKMGYIEKAKEISEDLKKYYSEFPEFREICEKHRLIDFG
jgi:glycosyltransferase involved in cell wall biosynthesis